MASAGIARYRDYNAFRLDTDGRTSERRKPRHDPQHPRPDGRPDPPVARRLRAPDQPSRNSRRSTVRAPGRLDVDAREPRPAGRGPDRATGARRAAGAGGDRHRPLGHQPHLRRERGGPLLRPRLRGGPRPAVPVRDVAPAGDRHGRGDPRAARARARHRGPAAPVPRRHDHRDEPLSRPRGPDHPGLREGHQRLRRPGQRRSVAAARRVRAARDHAWALDPRGGRLAPPGAGGQRHRRDPQRARGGPARRGRRQGAQLLLRRPRPEPRPRGGRVAAPRRHPRPLPRAPALGAVRARRHRPGPPRRPRHLRAARRRPAERDRPRATGLRGHRQQQLGGGGQPHPDGVPAHGQRPPPRAERPVAALLGAPGGAGLERHRGRRAGAAGGVHRPQRVRRVGADGLRAGQRGPLRLRHQPRRPEPVPAPRALGVDDGHRGPRPREGAGRGGRRAEVHPARPGALRGPREPQGPTRCARRGSTTAAPPTSRACAWTRPAPGRSSSRRAVTAASPPRTWSGPTATGTSATRRWACPRSGPSTAGSCRCRGTAATSGTATCRSPRCRAWSTPTRGSTGPRTTTPCPTATPTGRRCTTPGATRCGWRGSRRCWTRAGT